MDFSWSVTENDTSLKKFLATKGVSHRLFAQIKDQADLVTVNGQLADSATSLRAGDEVGLTLPAELADDNVPVSFASIDVVETTVNDLVVEKPAGLTVVPGPSNRTDTLVNRVKGLLVNEQSRWLVPHVITRLDRDTSGLVLVAKHRLANAWYNQEQADHLLKKRYLAVVSGQLTQSHAMIDRPLRRSTTGFNQVVAADGKPAQTEYWVRQTYSDQTLVEVVLHTGRTHQIRAHFADLGHPLLGDELYGGPMNQIDRQALHAFSLSFPDPVSGETRHYESRLPEDIQALLQ